MDTAREKIPSLPPLSQRLRHVHEVTDRFSLTNTYVIDDGSLIVVDPGSVLSAHLTLGYVQRFLQRSPTDIDLIVLTHLHPDHTGGVEALHQVCHAPVAASALARHMQQSKAPPSKSAQNAGLSNVLGQARHPSNQPMLSYHLGLFSPHVERQLHMIDLWLNDVAGLPNHPDWRVIASPGYTPESLCLYNPFSYELLCGEAIATLEGGSIVVRHGTNAHRLAETLRTLRSLQVHYLYPGHGRPMLSLRALTNAYVTP